MKLFTTLQNSSNEEFVPTKNPFPIMEGPGISKGS